MSWLDLQVRERPAAPALRVPAPPGGGTALSFSWRELGAAARRAARALAVSGAGPGRRVAVALPNTAEHVVAIHAVERLGAVLVPVDPRLDGAELDRRLEAVGAELLVTDEGTAGAGVSWTGPRIVPGELLSAEGSAAVGRVPEPPAPAAAPEDDVLHSILFTSGSTGIAEPVPLTRGNHRSSAAAVASNLGVGPDDDWLCCLPLVHVGGLAIVLRSVLRGASITLLDRFDAARTARLLVEPPDGRPVTLASLVPTMLRRLLPALPSAGGGGPAGASLRAVLVGGGPVTPELLAEAVSRRVPALATYGMTETASQVTAVPPERFPRGIAARPASAGPPLPGVELEIRRPGESGPVAGVGEIWVRGPMVSLPAAERSGGRDGWLRTGDLGRIDADGDLRVVGRRDQVIVTGGENVSPERVEEALAAHPGVADCAVVGIDDPEWGRAVAAAVVPADPAAPPAVDRLAAWCRDRLAPFEVPKRWRFLPAIPRTAAGKVARRTVAREWGAGR